MNLRRRLLKALAAGDVVTVTRIDRLARSTFDLFAIVKRIVDAGGQFRSLAEPWADTGTSTIRKISPAGSVTTFAGRAGVIDIVDGTGDAARFANPTGPSSAGSASSGGRIRIVVCRLPDPAGRGPRVFPLFLTRASCFAGPP